MFGDILDGFGFYFGAHEFGFGTENGAFVLEFGELEIEGAGPGETGSEAGIDGLNLGGEAVRGDDDLLIELVEIIKNIEKLFLGFFLIHNELKVINDEAV